MFDQENMQRQMESSQEAIAQRMDFSQVPLGFPSLDAMENPGENPNGWADEHLGYPPPF